MTEFEDENVDDTADRALEIACKQLDKFQWLDCDLGFYFNQIESRMASVGVKKQWTKYTVLNTILPMKIQTEVKAILRKKQADFTDNMSYKTLKTEILRIFGPKMETGWERALQRTLVGKPSQLARSLIDDICLAGDISCRCCPAAVLAVWKRSLPVAVKAAIAGKPFNKDNLASILALADEVFDTCGPSGVSVAAINVAKFQPGADSQGQVTLPTPATDPGQEGSLAEQVAALSREVKSWRGSQAGKGIRGSSGSNRGRGGGRGGRGGLNGSNNNDRGPRHRDGPPLEACKHHWKWGQGAYMCSDPFSCPWKDYLQPKPK